MGIDEVFRRQRVRPEKGRPATGESHVSHRTSLLAAGVVALLFQPARERLQRSVDRVTYGEREPYIAMSRLGEAVGSSADLDDLLPTIVGTRIVEEAQTNVARHARARSCRVRLERNGALVITVADDGRGVILETVQEAAAGRERHGPRPVGHPPPVGVHPPSRCGPGAPARRHQEATAKRRRGRRRV